MEVHIDDKIYVVKWQHSQYNSTHRVSNGTTQCSIDDIKNTMPVHDATGICICALGDNYDKNKGRKISMQRALEELDLSRSHRQIFWDAYYEMRNNKW